MSERTTFSPLWHRVRAMTPRLRPHAQITRQFYRRKRWHVVHDPASNQFYRLSPVAHEYVGLLDGKRSVEEVWNIVLQRHGDGAPTQPEVLELLGHLYQANLLTLDATPQTEQLLMRGRDRLKQRAIQQAIGLMYFKVRVFNPDRYLAWLEPILRPLLNRWGFIAWCLWILAALWSVLPQWDTLTSGFQTAVAPANWGWMAVVFVVLKVIHETGHGVLCKRFGGQVPEFGFFMLVLLPSPYVEASAAWAFPNKWQRTAVGAGGMMFEMAVAALAAHVWLNSGPGLAHQLAYNAMLSASLSTVLFNANPLMRFDGYYMLSDVIEVPNLMQRSSRMVLYILQRYIYRIRHVRPPSTVPTERAILLVFGLASLAYRVFVFVSVTLYMMGMLFAIGLVLAVWSAAAWFFLPLGKFIHWLATSPSIADRRPRAVLTSIAIAALAFTLLGGIPLPDRRRAMGVVESVERSGVFFGTDGFVRVAHVHVGDRVHEGDPILTLENDDVRARAAEVRAQIAEGEGVLLKAIAMDAASASVIREQLVSERGLLDSLEQRLADLIVRAPHDGVVVPGLSGVDPQGVIGAYVKRGQMVCEVVDPRTRVTATIETEQAAPLVELPADRYRVEMRPVSSPFSLVRASDIRVAPAAIRDLPHPALGYAGGGEIAIESRDQQGMRSTRPFFRLRVEGAVDESGQRWFGTPGERVHLRLCLPSRPLLWQWTDRFRRLIQGRADL
jgi:putative peptide zinc metalloprotease protein